VSKVRTVSVLLLPIAISGPRIASELAQAVWISSREEAAGTETADT
jgi:hypothetical protein